MAETLIIYMGLETFRYICMEIHDFIQFPTVLSLSLSLSLSQRPNGASSGIQDDRASALLKDVPFDSFWRFISPPADLERGDLDGIFFAKPHRTHRVRVSSRQMQIQGDPWARVDLVWAGENGSEV